RTSNVICVCYGPLVHCQEIPFPQSKGLLMKTRCALTLSIVVVASSMVSVSQAVTPTSYKFSGAVTDVDSPLPSQFDVGENVSGHMDLTLAVAEFDRAFYSVTNFMANIGGDYALTSTGGAVTVLNNFGDSYDHAGLDVISPTDGLSGAHSVAGHVPD